MRSIPRSADSHMPVKTLATVIVALSTVALFANPWTEEAVPLLSDFGTRNQLMPGQACRILRIDIDVTGDGRPELLLAKAERLGQLWSVYEQAGDQRYRLLGEVGFPYWAFMLKEKPTVLVAPYSFDDGTSAIATYQIDSGGIRRLSLEATTTPGSLVHEDFVAWRKKTGLRVAATSLDDVETDPSPRWEDELGGRGERIEGIGGLLGLTVLTSP